MKKLLHKSWQNKSVQVCALAPPLGGRPLCKKWFTEPKCVCSMYHALLLLCLLTWPLLHNRAPPLPWTSPLAFSTGPSASSSSPVDMIPAIWMQQTHIPRQTVTTSVRQCLVSADAEPSFFTWPSVENELTTHLSVCSINVRGPASGAKKHLWPVSGTLQTDQLINARQRNETILGWRQELRKRKDCCEQISALW